MSTGPPETLAGASGSRHHRAMRPLAGLLWLAVGCNQSPSAAPAAEPAAPRPAPATQSAPAPPASAASAASDCVESCVERRQMQAVSPQQIEADCRAECEKK